VFRIFEPRAGGQDGLLKGVFRIFEPRAGWSIKGGVYNI